MNIYLLERKPDAPHASWDDYESFVVCAPNAEVAKGIQPLADYHANDDDYWSHKERDHWVSPSSVKVTLLGVAHEQILTVGEKVHGDNFVVKGCVICANNVGA